MKKKSQTFLSSLLLFACCFSLLSVSGQAVIFSENVGTGTGTQTILATTFQNSGTLTYSGSADTRTTTASSGYTGASGGKNVFFTNSAGINFEISNINTSNYTGISLSFGHLKTTTASNNELIVEVSSDGTNYSPLNYTRPTGSGTATSWLLIAPTGSIPAASNLRIRFRQTSLTAQFRIDDIVLKGTLSVAAPSVTTNAATEVTASSATLNATINANGTTTVPTFQYGITNSYGSTISGGENVTGTTAVTRNAIISGLSPNTVYNFRAVGTVGTTATNGNNATFTTLANVPAAPTVNGATTSTLDVTVNANGNPATTTYAIRINGGGLDNQYISATGTITGTAVFRTVAQWGTRTVTGLTFGTQYTFDVQARNSASVTTAFSNNATGTTAVPSEPYLALVSSNLTFGNVCINTQASGSFVVSGGNFGANTTVVVFPIEGYTYSLTQNGEYVSLLSIPNYTGITTTIYVRFSPTAVQSYPANISLSATGGASLDVPVSAAGINPAATGTTGGATAITATTVTLSGSAVSGGCSAVSAYGIEYSTTNNFTNGSGTQVAGSGTAVNYTVALSLLSPNVIYYYKAFATDGTGTIYGSQQSFTTANLGTPVATAATDVSGAGFVANWNPVAGATGYRLDISTQANFAATSSTSPWINEFHYDNAGTDTDEFVEIAVPVGYNAANLTVALYNGNGGVLYDTKNFSNLVAGATTNGYTLYSYTYPSNLVQNGPDAIALSDGTALLQFISYGGAAFQATNGPANGVTSTPVSQAESASTPAGYSLSLTGTGNGYSSFTWASPAAATKGAINGGQTFTAPGAGSPAYVYENLDTGNVTSYLVSGLNEFTTYYYRVRATSATSTSANSNTASATTRVVTVTWNGSAWSPSAYPDGTTVVLDETLDAVIAGNFNTATDYVFVPKSLTLNSGTFTVATGTTFKVVNQIVNNATASAFVIENEGNLIQGNDIANTGSITVRRNSNELYRNDYTIWSSPVAGQNLFSFSPETLANRFYVYGMDGTPASEEFIGVTPDNGYAANGGTANFVPARGYLIRMPNEIPGPDHLTYDSGTASHVFEGKFTGVPNNGTVNLPYNVVNGYNMVGNPYPSPINVGKFFNDNAANLSMGEGIYFWRKRNSTEATSYAILSMDGYIANDGGAASENDPGEYTYGGQQWETYFQNTPDSEWTIAQGQGFFVKANNDGTGLTFNNAMRQEPAGGQPFFRTAQDNTVEKSRLWLNLSAPELGFSQSAIVYNPLATTGLDFGRDARAFGTSGKLALYSVLGENNLAIQSRPAFESTDIVPMGYRADVAGTFTITLHRTEGVFAEGQQVYLKDNTTGLVHPLTDGDYNFVTESGIFNGRFEIWYVAEQLGTEGHIAVENAIVVYNRDNVLNVNSANVEMETITVFDTRGRILLRESNINGNEAALSRLQPQQQVLLIQITTPDGTVTKKVIY